MSYATSVIKSIQRGSVVIADGSETNTVTLSSVTTGKTSVNWLGTSSTGSSTDPSRYLTRMSLTNATTLTVAKEESLSSVEISYEVVEFY